MIDKLNFNRQVPLRYEVDVFVAGGGPAGVAAAIAARNQGAAVFLAESQGCFGGMGTSGLVPAFMRLTDGVNFLADGIGRQVYERMKQQAEVPWDRPHELVTIPVEALKRVYDEMVSEAEVEFTFATSVIALEVNQGWIDHAVCYAKSGLFAVKARVYVDATGDGDLAVWAGAAFEKGDSQGNMMPGTLCSIWSDVDWERASGNDERALEKAFSDGIFTVQDRHLPGMWRVSQTLAGGNVGHTFGVDGTDEVSLTQALLWGRLSLVEYERYYKQYLPGFEKINLVVTGSLLGLRETRRITGDYVLCLDDFLDRAVFADEIGRYAYPIDIHASDPGKESYDQFAEEFSRLRYAPGESYGIPYRTLTPVGVHNLLVAGRCISSDRYIQGSVRVMPGCFITGQAAGVAAAMNAVSGASMHDLNIPELQRRLIELGAYLPNARIE